MTNQEVFDKVVTHLRKQGCKSFHHIQNGGGCAYRGSHDMKCAAGCLIPDEKYGIELEGKDWRDISHLFPEYLGSHRLISDLQKIHDSYAVGDWESAFKKTAEIYELTVPEGGGQ